MAFIIKFSEEKNQLLLATRGIGFNDIIYVLGTSSLIADIKHPKPKYDNQRIYLVNINEYIYVVPYVISLQKNEIFLKTIYPSRIFTQKYIKGTPS